MTECLLTPADVAERCQISAKSVLRAIHAGRLRAYRLGERGAYSIRESDIDTWIEASVVVAAPRTAVRPLPARAMTPVEHPATGRLELTAGMGRH